MIRLQHVREWIGGFSNTVIPPKCANCGNGGQLICEACLARIEWVCGGCTICGKAVFSDTICRACQIDQPAIDRIRSVAYFVPPVVELIHQFKYYDQFGLKRPLGEIMADRWPTHFGDATFDAIIPVPLSRRREKVRGYNQAGLLAEQLSIRLDIPLKKNWLRRRRETQPQARLSRAERMVNVQDAFEVGSVPSDCRRVLLVDDVCSTGATVNAITEVLKSAGVSYVAAYTFAKPF